jgi:uncharacterized caspase-like protein
MSLWLMYSTMPSARSRPELAALKAQTSRYRGLRPTQRALSLVCLFVCVLGTAFGVQAAERVALVIGNSAYPTSPLDNPRHDANAMADLLSAAGFQVEKQLDVGLAPMKAAVDRFTVALRDPQVKFALFYYAGHGMQQEDINYLIPVSAVIRGANDVPQQALNVSQLMGALKQSQGRSYLVILDACRNDPFAGSFKRSTKGLSKLNAPAGSLVAYATQPGNVALDAGGNGKNGLYTGYLLDEFAVKGAKVEDAFKRVRVKVRLASKSMQIPFESTSLEEDLQIFPGERRKLSEKERDQALAAEMANWARIKSSPEPELLARFLHEYPSGNASELAQSRLNRQLEELAQRADQLSLEAARAKAQLIQELARREEDARRRIAQAEQQMLAEQAAELERARQAKAEAARLEQRRLMAAQAAEELAEAARLNAQQAQAAEEALARMVAAQTLALERQQAQKAAAAQAEAALQSRLKAQTAQLEAERLQAAQQKLLEQEQEKQFLAEQTRVQQLALAQKQQREANALLDERAGLLASVAGPPEVAGYVEHRRRYSLGDEANFRVIDAFTKASKPLSMTVTRVDMPADRLEYNGGEFESDLMGNITSNRRGSLSTPRQFYPAELVVGKRWNTRFKQSRPSGQTYTFQYDLKVVAKEKITVPAGTFEAFKIEARGFNIELSAALERTIWVVPGVNADIAHETRVRLSNGRWDQNDRQELVSYKQARE